MALFPRYLTGGLERAYKRGAEDIRSAPIATRVLGAIGVLAVLVAIAFAVVLLAMSNLRSSTDEQVQANRVTASTLRLGRVVDELEGSLRSFVLTRNDRIRPELEPGRGQAPAGDRRAVEPRRVAARPEAARLRDDRAHPRLRDRLRQPPDRDRARQPGSGALPGRVARRADAHRRDPARAGDPARARGPARLRPRRERERPGKPRRAGRRRRARRLGPPAAARDGLSRPVGRTSGPRRRDRRGADRRGRLLDPHPAGGPGRDPGAHRRVQLDGLLGRVGAPGPPAPERAAAPERAGEVGADHDRRARAAHAAREHPRLHEPHPPARHRRGLAAPVRRDHPRPGAPARRARRRVPLRRRGWRPARARSEAARPRARCSTTRSSSRAQARPITRSWSPSRRRGSSCGATATASSR